MNNISVINRLNKPAIMALLVSVSMISACFRVIHETNPDSQSTTVEVKIDLTFRKGLPKSE